MMEGIATLLGRHLHVRGIERALQVAYPFRQDSRRYVSGRRQRGDGLWMNVDSRTLIDWHLLFRGEWEHHLGVLFSALSNRGAVAIDVGANVGAHTLTLARLVGPTGRVLAFEPNPAVKDRLVENVDLNHLAQVHVFGCALGEATATLELRVPKADSGEASNPGLASLVALETPHDLVTVAVRRLDDVIAEAGLQRLDVVKIDVQGYEYRTLQGMPEAIRRFAPAIIFEYEGWAWQLAGSSFEETAAWFQKMDYAFWRIDARRGGILRSHPLFWRRSPPIALQESTQTLLRFPETTPDSARCYRLSGPHMARLEMHRTSLRSFWGEPPCARGPRGRACGGMDIRRRLVASAVPGRRIRGAADLALYALARPMVTLAEFRRRALWRVIARWSATDAWLLLQRSSSPMRSRSATYDLFNFAGPILSRRLHFIERGRFAGSAVPIGGYSTSSAGFQPAGWPAQSRSERASARWNL
jgi:FkbM family methyltransferase